MTPATAISEFLLGTASDTRDPRPSDERSER
jgi:hypothetical protein